MRFEPRCTGLLLLALVALGTGACQSPEPVDRRTVVLGFDGMDPELTRRWMDQGLLPHFKALAERGHFQALGTSSPPQSPVAWSSFATGHNPGRHGIFDFLRRQSDSYAPAFSISETMPPQRDIELFGYKIPLGSGEIVNRRQGEPFWTTAEERGWRASVLRVPVTYPPDPIHRMLAGMGVPDLLGTQGTYTLYTTGRPGGGDDASRFVRVRPHRDGSIETVLKGPEHPLHADPEPMEIPLRIEPTDDGVAVTLQGKTAEIAEGEWSSWMPVSFDIFGPTNVDGLVRMHLVQDFPRLRLYVSPIQIDPHNPAVPLSSPGDYASELAERIGHFHTIGMPEETWSLNDEHLTDDAWLDMVETILGEREAMWYDTLQRRDSELVVGVFVQTDRVSHMFYRGMDHRHPRHASTDERGRNAIRWIYREADRILGETLDKLGPQDRLIVLSDHGFAPFRRAVHLNRWLIDNGYMHLEDGAQDSGPVFAAVDWSRTEAYALGLNGIFINRRGREPQGIVSEGEVQGLEARIAADLRKLKDPSNGTDVVRRVLDAGDVYRGGHMDDAPDLIVGYSRGYRASWQTTLGAAPKKLIEPNDKKWSGDHCIDPALVPGVLFTNFQPQTQPESIADIAELALPPKQGGN